MNVARTRGGDWATIRTLLPYLWEYKGRVIAALACLVLAKVANVGVPLLLKEIVDSLDNARRRRCSCRSRCWSRTACCACRRRCSPSFASSCSPR